MFYPYAKALHLIFMVAWFAGLFFMGRMLIYYVESDAKSPELKQELQQLLKGAGQRVWYIITLPSIILTIMFGLHLMAVTKAYMLPWFHAKMSLIILFLFYNFYLNKLRLAIQKGARPGSGKLRLLNEVPFLFLIGIVFTVYLRNAFQGLWASGALILILVGLGLLVRARLKAKNKL